MLNFKVWSKRNVIIMLAMVALAALIITPVAAKGFVHAPVIVVDGVDYFMAGPPDGPNGATDIPGHSWIQTGPDRLIGKHVNTGPFGAPSWWSSDAGDGALLFKVKGIIDTWTPEKAAAYAQIGFVHYHELVNIETGKKHPTKVVWLKHIARSSFNFDGGPHPELAHYVTPGVDFNFIPNGMMPYNPNE